MSQLDLTSSIERMRNMEERLGVQLSGLSAFVSTEEGDHYVELLAELTPVAGDELACDVTIEVMAYDDEGRVVGSGSDSFWADDFFGVGSVSVMFQSRAVPRRLRVLAQKG